MNAKQAGKALWVFHSKGTRYLWLNGFMGQNNQIVKYIKAESEVVPYKSPIEEEIERFSEWQKNSGLYKKDKE